MNRCFTFLYNFCSEYFRHDTYLTSYTRHAQSSACRSSLKKSRCSCPVLNRRFNSWTNSSTTPTRVTLFHAHSFSAIVFLHADRRTYKTGEANRRIFATILWKRAKRSTSLHRYCATYTKCRPRQPIRTRKTPLPALGLLYDYRVLNPCTLYKQVVFPTYH